MSNPKISLSYVPTKEQMPSYVDHQCTICLEDVDVEQIGLYGLANCVICINGHRMHRTCYESWNKHYCPTCKVKEADAHIRNCYAPSTGYGYGERRGGRRRNKTHKKRKTHKRKKTKINRRKM